MQWTPLMNGLSCCCVLAVLLQGCALLMNLAEPTEAAGPQLGECKPIPVSSNSSLHEGKDICLYHLTVWLRHLFCVEVIARSRLPQKVGSSWGRVCAQPGCKVSRTGCTSCCVYVSRSLKIWLLLPHILPHVCIAPTGDRRQLHLKWI